MFEGGERNRRTLIKPTQTQGKTCKIQKTVMRPQDQARRYVMSTLRRRATSTRNYCAIIVLPLTAPKEEKACSDFHTLLTL